MKKMLWLLLAAGALAAVLAACGAKRGERASQEVNTMEGLTLTVENASGTQAEYTIHNNTEKDVVFGRDFAVQTLHNGVWYELQHKDMAITLELLFVPAGSEETFTAVWEPSYGTLPAGDYRILKTVTAGEESVILAGEFSVS